MPSCDVVESVPTVISAVSVMVADVTAAILLSICDCVYPEAVVKTPWAPHVIFPLLSIEHTVDHAEFWIVKALSTVSLRIVNAVDLIPVGRIVNPFPTPFLTTFKLIYSGPAEQSVNIHDWPIKALS